MKRMLKEILCFFKGHWPHLLIAIPAAVVFTALHEFAHCAAVWVQGGNVTDFAWLPSEANWGYMQYTFPSGANYSEAAISLSPYACWIGLCLLAGVLSLKRSAWRFWCASTIFVWLFVVPLADIANTTIPYLLRNAQNDMQDAFGPACFSYAVIAFIFFIAVGAYGFMLNKRLYRDRSVSVSSYCVLAAAAGLIILAITG